MGYDTVLVKHVKDGISVLSHISLSTKFNMWVKTYLGQTSSEHDNLIYLCHFCQKVVDTRSLDDINVVHLRFNLYRYNVIRCGQLLIFALSLESTKATTHYEVSPWSYCVTGFHRDRARDTFVHGAWQLWGVIMVPGCHSDVKRLVPHLMLNIDEHTSSTGIPIPPCSINRSSSSSYSR